MKLAVAVVLALGTAGAAAAQIAVSSNDSKVVLIDGVNTVVRNPPPDTATIVDVGVTPPRVLGQLNVPGSWQSPDFGQPRRAFAPEAEG